MTLVLEKPCSACQGKGFREDDKDAPIRQNGISFCYTCEGKGIILTEDGQVVARLIHRLMAEKEA